MDILVSTASDGKSWTLKDLLGRSLGRIEQNSPTEFVLHPAGKAVETMAVLNLKAFVSLDDALAGIETQTRGVCRRTDAAG